MELARWKIKLEFASSILQVHLADLLILLIVGCNFCVR